MIQGNRATVIAWCYRLFNQLFPTGENQNFSKMACFLRLFHLILCFADVFTSKGLSHSLSIMYTGIFTGVWTLSLELDTGYMGLRMRNQI